MNEVAKKKGKHLAPPDPDFGYITISVEAYGHIHSLRKRLPLEVFVGHIGISMAIGLTGSELIKEIMEVRRAS